MTQEFKQINYRDGTLKFQIPADWQVEYDDEGGGIFYEDQAEAGTLHLNLITLQVPTDNQDDIQVQALSYVAEDDDIKIEVLENGNALARSIQYSSEQEIELVSHWWYVVKQITHDSICMANFSYTVMKSEENTALFTEKINLLDSLIKNAIFSSQLASA